jgi:uncharacterized protein with ParB-like and HNH nuclease domain
MPSAKVDIQPYKQNIGTVFDGTVYHIDFYQRQYKWTDEQTETLLDDLFHAFDPSYEEDAPAKESVVRKYPWYYLNTYITNHSEEGEVYVVDGQQRLTTLTLILIKLMHLAEEQGLAESKVDLIKSKVADSSWEGETFWMGPGEREEVMQALFEGSEPEYSDDDVTTENMAKNYAVIDDYLDGELRTRHRLEMFALYFLNRVVLVNLDVKQTDVPMVFEVINDRGVRLDSHEILKGKLLGQIHKAEVNEYHDIWRSHVEPLDARDDADDFFSTYLKARFAQSRDDGQKFNDDYQRLLFQEPYNESLQFRDNVEAVKQFIKYELTYHVDLYDRIQRLADEHHEEVPHVHFNSLNRMGGQDILILAACEQGDAEEARKIREISQEFDRLYTLLQLNNAYDSNRFADTVYDIRPELVGTSVDEYRSIFDRYLLSLIEEQRGTKPDEPLRYRTFKSLRYGDLNRRFIRYFLTRVETFISEEIKRDLQDSYWNLIRSRGKNIGYHIEHILGRNEENVARFADEEMFEQERNRLGALLLLKGRDNQSSGNETYDEKLKTYYGTLYWNQSLDKRFYKSKLDHDDFFERHGLDFRPIETFDKEAIDHRTRLLFEMANIIWA